jgi:hypothetical protein
MNTIGYLFSVGLAVLLISYGTGTAVGRSHAVGEKVVKAELRFAVKVVRGILKLVCGWLAKGFHKAHKKL